MADVELVIKISEADYKFIKKTAEKEPSNLNYIARRILTGKVLPKGHGRLIDESEVIKSLFDFTNCKKSIGMCIDNAPTIIEADKESEE